MEYLYYYDDLENPNFFGLKNPNICLPHNRG